MTKEYIWYCPEKDCCEIILKTKHPYIIDGEFRCSKCGVCNSAENIVKANLGNLKKFIKSNA